jgi:hypothetical protein
MEKYTFDDRVAAENDCRYGNHAPPRENFHLLKISFFVSSNHVIYHGC